MFGVTCTLASTLWIILSSLIIGSEACAPGFTFAPDVNHSTRQCAPCKRSDDGPGSIWNKLFDSQQGLSEEPSPRFAFQVGPTTAPSAPCCETATAGTTTPPGPTQPTGSTQPPITRLQNITGDVCNYLKQFVSKIIKIVRHLNIS